MYRPADTTEKAESRWQGLLEIGARAGRFETRFEGTRRLIWHRWGTGPDVLLFHGGGGSWTHWYTTIPALEDRFTLWIPDIPGYGDSDMPAVEPLSHELIARYVVEGFHQLAPQARRLDIVGFSFGTLLLVHAVHLLEDLVRNAVIIGMNFVERRGGNINFVNWKKAKTDAERDAAIRANLLAIMIADPANCDEFAMRMQKQNLARQRLSPIALTDLTSMLDAVPRFPAQVQVIGVSGDRDFIARGAMDRQGESLARLKPGSRFHLIETSGHWVMHENPEALNRVLLGELAS